MTKLVAYSQQGVGDKGGVYVPTYTRHGTHKCLYFQHQKCSLLCAWAFVADPSPLGIKVIKNGWWRPTCHDHRLTTTAHSIHHHGYIPVYEAGRWPGGGVGDKWVLKIMLHYRKSGNFHVKNFRRLNFSVIKFCRIDLTYICFLMYRKYIVCSIFVVCDEYKN